MCECCQPTECEVAPVWSIEDRGQSAFLFRNGISVAMIQFQSDAPYILNALQNYAKLVEERDRLLEENERLHDRLRRIPPGKRYSDAELEGLAETIRKA